MEFHRFAILRRKSKEKCGFLFPDKESAKKKP
jgi:hypothetical protein